MVAAHSSKIRFAIGMFRSPEALSTAIEALTCRGVSRENVNVLASRAGAPGRDGVDDSRSINSSMLLDESLPDRLVFDLLVGSLGDSNDERKARCIGCDEWMMQRQSRRLYRHVADGGQTLVVRLQDDSKRHDVCALLLRYADQGMQTHELRVASRCH